MRRDLPTQFFGARQVMFWARPHSVLHQDIMRALPLPEYVIRPAQDLERVLAVLGMSKIEVMLMEVDGPAVLASLPRVRQVDPDIEVLVIAERSELDALDDAKVLEGVDAVGRPFSDRELSRRVELARERRFLRRSEQRRKGAEARMSAIV